MSDDTAREGSGLNLDSSSERTRPTDLERSTEPSFTGLMGADRAQRILDDLERASHLRGGEGLLAVGAFLRSMGWAEAHQRACEELGLDPDAEDPLEVMSRAERARMLGRVELARREGRGPELTAAESREINSRFNETAKLAVELCKERLNSLRRASLLTPAEARTEQKRIAKRWNDWGEANWFHPKYRLPFYKLCIRCDQPLVLVAQRRKRKDGGSPSPVIHPWCQKLQHSEERKKRKRLALKAPK